MSARTGIPRSSLRLVWVFFARIFTAVLMASAVSAVPKKMHAYKKHCNQNPEPICQYPIHFNFSPLVNFYKCVCPSICPEIRSLLLVGVPVFFLNYFMLTPAVPAHEKQRKNAEDEKRNEREPKPSIPIHKDSSGFCEGCGFAPFELKSFRQSPQRGRNIGVRCWYSR